MLQHYTHNDPETLIDETRQEIRDALTQWSKLDYAPTVTLTDPMRFEVAGEPDGITGCCVDVELAVCPIGDADQNCAELARQLRELATVLDGPEPLNHLGPEEGKFFMSANYTAEEFQPVQDALCECRTQDCRPEAQLAQICREWLEARGPK